MYCIVLIFIGFEFLWISGGFVILEKFDRASGKDPAALVLVGPVFLKVKMKFHFCKKQVPNKSVCVIFGLVRLIILSYNR